MNEITPRRIEWAAPEGWLVILDEDGVNLRPSGRALEEPDLLVEDIRAFFRPLRFGAAND